jgi:Peptidase M66
VRIVARVAWTVGAISASLVVAVPDGAAAVVGKQKVLAALVSYGPRPYARPEVTTAFQQADSFFRRSSFGRLSLQTTVTPWLGGGLAEPSCGASADRMFAPLRAVATAAGFPPGSYDRIIYVVAGPDCGFHGIEGGNEVMVVTQPDAHLLVHELGHTFGLPHAGASSVCGTFCVTQEQGDLFSPMGIGFTDFSAYEKEQLGWIPRQARITRAGQYVVEALGGTLARQAAVLEAPEGEYWFEQRPGLATPALIVRLVQPDTQSRAFIAPTTMLLAPIRAGHPTITAGQTFRVAGEFSVTVKRAARVPLRLRVSLAATLR